MKFAIVLTLAALIMPGTIAVDPRFPDSGPFNMIVLAYNTTIHYSHVQADGGYFTIGTATNSSCGDVPPILNGGNGAISTYSNDSSMRQQGIENINP